MDNIDKNIDKMSRAIEEIQQGIQVILELNEEGKKDRADIKSVIEELKVSVHTVEQKVKILTADNITYLKSEVM